MFDIDFEAIALAILNRPEDPRSLPEELEAVRAELRVYEDMQANLNSNLAEYPDILDALETLQCSVFPPEEISAPFQLEEKYFDKYKELQKELDDRERHIELQRVRMGKDVVNLNNYAQVNAYLEGEVSILNLRNRNQTGMLEDYEKETLRLESLVQLYRDRLATVSRDYSNNADMWRKAYEDLEQYKQTSC